MKVAENPFPGRVNASQKRVNCPRVPARKLELEQANRKFQRCFPSNLRTETSQPFYTNFTSAILHLVHA